MLFVLYIDNNRYQIVGYSVAERVVIAMECERSA